MKFIKGLIKFILGLLIIVILLGGGTYVFVRVKYGIDPINTINQLSQLNEKVDEKKLAPDPFDENDLTGAMTSLNNSVPNLVSYDEQNGYSFNYSIDKRFVATYQITDKELGALADTLLKTQAKDGIKIGDTLVPISLIDFSFSPNIISGETITTFSVLVKISLDPFIAKMSSFPLNMLRNKVPENLIEESNTYYETDDQDILRAREQFNKLVEKYEEQIKEEKQKEQESAFIYQFPKAIRKTNHKYHIDHNKKCADKHRANEQFFVEINGDFLGRHFRNLQST